MNDLLNLCESIARLYECKLSVATAKELTTFKGGGSAYVFFPSSGEQLARVYGALKERGYSPIILGGGSNTVIADGRLNVPLISTRGLRNIYKVGGRVYAECGARISDVSAALRELSMGGLDFLSGVPATVGGAIRMNAGAFGRQTSEYVREVQILSFDRLKGGEYCKTVTINAENENTFGYRRGVRDIVLGAVFEGEQMSADESLARAREYAAKRAAKQPKLPSCGSVFKNGSVSSGKLIDDCGLKGVSIGGAQISEMHANFIVNTGGATANDFMSLVKLCEERVREKFGITLEREFVYLENK